VRFDVITSCARLIATKFIDVRRSVPTSTIATPSIRTICA
jgi:hypothetical protein